MIGKAQARSLSISGVDGDLGGCEWARDGRRGGRAVYILALAPKLRRSGDGSI